MGPGCGAFEGDLEVLGQPAAAVQPGEGALDHPSARRELETLGFVRSFDDLKRPCPQRGHGVAQLFAAVAPIGKHVPQPRVERAERGQDIDRTVAILDVGGVDLSGPVPRVSTSPPAQSGCRCDPAPSPAVPWSRHPAAAGFPRRARNGPEPPVDCRHRRPQAHRPDQRTVGGWPQRTGPLRIRLRRRPRPGVPPRPPNRRPRAPACLCVADSWLVGVLLLERPVLHELALVFAAHQRPFCRKVHGFRERVEDSADPADVRDCACTAPPAAETAAATGIPRRGSPTQRRGKPPRSRATAIDQRLT